MKLSLWVYSHRFGIDIIKVLAKDDAVLTAEDVIAGAEIDFEEDKDEWLAHEVDLPLGDTVDPGLLRYVWVQK